MKKPYVNLALLLCVPLLPANAALIGQWSGSLRTWNSGEMSTINAAMVAAGNTVSADEAITAGNLAAAQVFVIGEPGAAPTSGELSLLSSWVSSGGILLLLADSGNSGTAALNAITAALGSTLGWTGSASSNPAFAGGNFATTGPPFNIVGQTLDISPAAAVTGGTALAGDFLRYQQIGSGFLFGFGDRSDHNAFSPNSSTVNGQLFLNIVNRARIADSSVPEPSTIVFVAAGLAVLGLRRIQAHR